MLDFADEESVVQTRFATTALALLLAGDRLSTSRPRPPRPSSRFEARCPSWPRYGRFAFLGAGWTVGLANEAALKLREAAGAWAEAYPAMEYRHGPISANADETLVWPIGAVDPGVLDDAGAGRIVDRPRTATSPLASLVLAQRAAVALAPGPQPRP